MPDLWLLHVCRFDDIRGKLHLMMSVRVPLKSALILPPVAPLHKETHKTCVQCVIDLSFCILALRCHCKTRISEACIGDAIVVLRSTSLPFLAGPPRRGCAPLQRVRSRRQGAASPRDKAKVLPASLSIRSKRAARPRRSVMQAMRRPSCGKPPVWPWRAASCRTRTRWLLLCW